MEKPGHSNNPPVVRWLQGFMALFLFGPIVLSGITQTIHKPDFIPTWLIYTCQGVGFLCWGIASLIMAIMQHRHKPHASFYTQPRLWFGLLGFTILPDSAILALEATHMLSENPVTDTIMLISITMSVICLIPGVYFWWPKPRMVER